MFATEREFTDFLVGAKRWLFFETLKMVYSQFKQKKWAIGSLTTCVRSCYLVKERFSEEESDEMADMLQALRTQSQLALKSGMTAELQDGKIKANPL